MHNSKTSNYQPKQHSDMQKTTFKIGCHANNYLTSSQANFTGDGPVIGPNYAAGGGNSKTVRP